jgi:uncharacterized RDD family membrane protein YckC
MDHPARVDPLARTFTEVGAGVSARLITTPAGPAVDPRADTIPSDPDSLTPAKGAERDPLLGHMLGHFRVDALIGRGGMGAVYRAWDTSLLRPVAIKVLLADTANARTRFLREARSQAQLRHPNVVPIHYVGESEGIVFLVMDLVEGESLTDLIRREGRVGEGRALDIVDAVASALAAGHQAGLIHRDVKPSNILLERSGRALLADFGLAKDIAAADLSPGEPDPQPVSLRNNAGLTRAGSIVGTPAYLAPEQAAAGPVDHRADMYALGASLFEALTGAPPFDAPTPTGIVELQRTEVVRSPRALVGDLHPSVEKLVLRLMQKQAADRFATYDELRAAIGRARTPPLIPGAPTPRFVAFCIDYMLFGIIGLTIHGGLLGMGLRLLPVPWAVAVLGATVLEWRLGGAGLGKRLMSLRTVDRYGLPPRFSAVLGRTCFKALCPALIWLEKLLPSPISQGLAIATALFWIVGLAIALGEKRLSLHDRVTGTRVVFGAPASVPRSERA